MKRKRNGIQQRLQSFKYAFHGFYTLIKEEPNARIHLLAAVCAIVLGIVLKISPIEWIAIGIGIGLVFMLEFINSALERISDYISPEKNDEIKKIKDLAAGGVLVAAMVALFIGIILFVPKIVSLIQ